jgi:hypothetical protein
VTALVSLPEDAVPEAKTDHRAKQFIGWLVGELMREHGHAMIKRRPRAGFFSVAAVWSRYLGRSVP